MSGSNALVRIGLLAVAVVLSAASGAPQTGYQQGPAGGGNYAPPASQPMDPTVAVGLFRTSFGPVKIELDAQRGSPHVAGIWVYEREGEEVIGLFQGALDGNVLEFQWQEPSSQGAPLMGAGYLVFQSDGSGFYGKWWTSARDRTGDWTGQRHQADAPEGGDEPPPEPEPEPEPTGYPYDRTI